MPRQIEDFVERTSVRGQSVIGVRMTSLSESVETLNVRVYWNAVDNGIFPERAI